MGIVRLDTELNARVNDLFDLTPEEVQTIEESTAYRYGEVYRALVEWGCGRRTHGDRGRPATVDRETGGERR